MITNVLAALALTLFSTQAGPTGSSTTSPPSTDSNKPITLSGCVSRGAVTQGQFALSDASTGGRYRLSGVRMKKFAGQRVQIVGSPVNRRLTIRGGLLPSPNAAGQAGAQDPAQVAIASLPGGANSGTGTVELPEFRVTRVRSLGGSCQ